MKMLWIFRVMESGPDGPDPRIRGNLACFEDKESGLGNLVEFIPDHNGPDMKHRRFRICDPQKPVLDQDVEFEGDVFRPYSELGVTGTPVTTKVVSIKSPMKVL